MTDQARLSKSQYVQGAQCVLSLWFSRNRKDLTPPVDAAQQAMFEAGNEVGGWAKKYFLNGVEVTTPFFDSDAGEAATYAFIQSGHEAIFEATAISKEDGSHARIDILRKTAGAEGWDLIEVKGSTSVKDYHLDDMAFQYRVFTGAGFLINQCFMMLIDNQYVRQGDIDVHRLFRFEDITHEVRGKQSEIGRIAASLSNALDSPAEPQIKVGARCFKPFDCHYAHHCWRDIPQYSVYNVYDSKKADEIVDAIGSYEVGSIPTEMLPTGIKGNDVRSYVSDTVYKEPSNIRQFLAGLQYPIYYLDYETIAPTIPAFDATRPFQTVPFQFSLHIEDEPGADLRHYEFLHKEQSDPRLAFIQALISLCGDRGSVVTYNQAFEEGVNKALMRDFPVYAEKIDAINFRMIDLLIPFRKRWLYHPSQHGSASIKKVLPAFSDLSYEGLAIGNGLDASNKYAAFISGTLSDGEVALLWQGLTEYCGLDTLAMKALVDALKAHCR